MWSVIIPSVTSVENKKEEYSAVALFSWWESLITVAAKPAGLIQVCKGFWGRAQCE